MTELIKKIDFQKIKRPKISKNVLIFSVFLIISTVFWFLNALEKKYKTEIFYPIKFTNFPENKIPIGNLPNKISVKLNSYGFEIIGKLRTNKSPININVKKLAIKNIKSNKTNEYYILTSSLLKNLNTKTGAEIDIINIFPDSLNFKLVDIISKKVPVKANLKFHFKQMYIQNGKIKLKPDSITISGLKDSLNLINYVTTSFQEFKNINDTLIEKINIFKKNNIKYSHNEIELFVPSEKYTESNLKVPVKVVNIPDSLKIITFPKVIKISFRIGISMYKKIKSENFEITVDYKLMEINNNKLKIILKKYPEEINYLKYYPKYVDFVIEQKTILSAQKSNSLH